ncbi:uncharacterized protein PG986_003860 [Apiospora aurea]|uniref:Uncharacterized protein n=1 Tax=Apiospora aurea TaxID=335848 RepID=A0ABR1QLA2_9PEZI
MGRLLSTAASNVAVSRRCQPVSLVLASSSGPVSSLAHRKEAAQCQEHTQKRHEDGEKQWYPRDECCWNLISFLRVRPTLSAPFDQPPLPGSLGTLALPIQTNLAGLAGRGAPNIKPVQGGVKEESSSSSNGQCVASQRATADWMLGFCAWGAPASDHDHGKIATVRSTATTRHDAVVGIDWDGLE